MFTLRRGDVVIAKTDPPTISVLVALAAKLRSARLVNWCQDLFPEIAGALGVSCTSGSIGRVLSALRNASLRSAATNIVLDFNMAAKVRAASVDEDRIVLTENWCDTASQPVVRKENALAKSWGDSARAEHAAQRDGDTPRAWGHWLDVVRAEIAIPALAVQDLVAKISVPGQRRSGR